eukprot:Em0003g1168a
MYPIVNNIKAAVKLSGIEEVPEHCFIVIEQLISQVILGVDFLQQQGLVLDFTTLPVLVTIVRQKRPTPVSTAPGPAPLPEPEALQAIRKGRERERGERRGNWLQQVGLPVWYWQVPVDPKDQEKTAFSPGPGMRLFQFTRMPFGLCGAPSTFQRLMDVDTQKSEESFQRLKACLTEAPVLAYPWFVKHASAMVLQTDASNVGLGAVLEQDQRVVGYASRTLTKAEANYSAIQRECLAIVWAMKQFHHYLLGRTFQLMMDHAPLQWLGEQKMEGLLCRWALAIQECSFEIEYRKGTTNGNADALSRRRGPDRETLHAALTTMHAGFTAEEIRQAQQQDKTTLQLKYHPGPTSDTLVAPVLPEALHQQVLSMCHDSQAAGHQGTHKTLERMQREAYWVNMAQDVDRHCRSVSHARSPSCQCQVGDGMVERFNRSLLQLLRTYIEKQENWEQHLPLVLQKVDDDRHSAERPFEPGDLVWLSVPTAGKLDPRMGGELDNAHLSNGDQLVMLDVFPLSGIGLFKLSVDQTVMVNYNPDCSKQRGFRAMFGLNWLMCKKGATRGLIPFLDTLNADHEVAVQLWMSRIESKASSGDEWAGGDEEARL